MKKSATLMELMIAIALLAVIVLAAGSFDVASRYFLRSTETKVEALNELTLVLEHLHKNILLGIGDISNLGIWVEDEVEDCDDCVSLLIRQDQSETPSNYADDVLLNYLFKPEENEIWFYDGTSWKMLTDNFIDLGPYGGTSFGIQAPTSSGGVQIDHLATVYDPQKYTDETNPDQDPRTNAVVTTEDITGSATVFFYPLSHSWN